MTKRRVGLGIAQVRRLEEPGVHFVGGAVQGEVVGLALRISDQGTKSWVLRYKLNGRRREMGLGRYPDVSLASAREDAFRMGLLAASGIDPIDFRKSLLDLMHVDLPRVKARLHAIDDVARREHAAREGAAPKAARKAVARKRLARKALSR